MQIPRWLLLGVVWVANCSSACPQTLTYKATAVADTVELFQPVWVHFVTYNLTADTIPVSPLTPDMATHVMIVYNDRGDSVVDRYTAGTYLWQPGDAIAPHGTKEDYTQLDYFSRFRDSLSGRGYFPPGTYRMVSRWRYDPWGRTTVGRSPFLCDTIEFHVLTPSGRDSLAMVSFIGAERERGTRRAELLWQTYRQFPQSCYAPDCLSEVAMSMHIKDSRVDWLALPDVVHALALVAPNHPRVVREIKLTSGWNESGVGWAEKGKNMDREFLRSIADSVPPDSRAGKICASLLNGVESEVLHLTPGFGEDRRNR